ncbi:thioesterase [Nocardioides gansuensis]|uniref:Thioesterase n=1 Tax=Nocardioides gansuensis TaxID=2138300 RepID=A0A2T8F637_9ACTN|nr:thioesterase family protein [Nocardioides gansuensis]PVG81159.1 thioesterase [Nocardioides gansuensis]
MERVWVLIHEHADGTWGAGGQMFRYADLVALAKGGLTTKDSEEPRMGDVPFYRPLPAGLPDVDADVATSVETFESTDRVEGPWGPMQHGGAIASLLGRALDRCEQRPDTRLARITVELLGPVPIADVRVSTRVLRPGRRIQLLGAELEAQMPEGGWRRVASGSAWRLATQDTADVNRDAAPSRPLPAPETAGLLDYVLPVSWRQGGFGGALDWRVSHQGHAPGEPTLLWADLTCQLVEGEEPTPLERLLAVADTANGVGARLDPHHFLFLNTDLTVHLHQPPAGRWFGVEAETSVGTDGIATSSAVLHSATGPVGRVDQSVLVERRPS